MAQPRQNSTLRANPKPGGDPARRQTGRVSASLQPAYGARRTEATASSAPLRRNGGATTSDRLHTAFRRTFFLAVLRFSVVAARFCADVVLRFLEAVDFWLRRVEVWGGCSALAFLTAWAFTCGLRVVRLVRGGSVSSPCLAFGSRRCCALSGAVPRLVVLRSTCESTTVS